MNPSLATLLALASLAVVLACDPARGAPAEKRPVPATANQTNRFTITGMHCDGCARGLMSELKRAPGVASAEVSFTNTLAIVAFDTNRTTTAKLIKVVEEAGFKATKAPR